MSKQASGEPDFDAQKCGSYDMHVDARLDEAMWWAHNATNGHITDKAMKRIEILRRAVPAPVSALRGPDPNALYRCPYCNKDGRLRDAGMVVDRYMNVCHYECLPEARDGKANS